MIINTKLLKESLADLKKFLGSKVSPISFRATEDHLEISQFSPLASARVRIGYNRITKPPKPGTKVATDASWLTTSLSKASDKEVEIIFSEGSTKIKFANSSTSSANHLFEQLEDSTPETHQIPSKLIDFVRENSKLLRMKSFFTNRPLAATMGTIKKKPFFMVNDQYHGFVAIGTDELKKDVEKFSMDASSAAAIAFDPNSIEEQQRLSLSITEGRVYIHYPSVTYEVPAFEPSAVPSLEEIAELVGSFSAKKSHLAEVNIDALEECMRLFKHKDESQMFTITGKSDQIKFQYSSKTIDSDGVVSASTLKWPEKISVDPSMFVEIVVVLSDYSNTKGVKKEDRESQISISKGRDSNILMLRGHPVLPVRQGFVILTE